MKSKSTLRRPTLMVQVITCLCLLALTPLASAERFNTFYHTDHLGNVMGASDDDGVYTPIVGNNYKSYGDSGGYSRPDPSDPAYTGKKFDPHTGLYYFGGRYYDPDAKRFISPDPMAYSPANPISFNRYAYANNNPLIHVDPDGNIAFIPIILGGLWLADKGWAAYDGYQDAKAIQSGDKTLGDVVAARAVEHAAGLALGAFGRFGVKVSNRVYGAAGGVANKANATVDVYRVFGGDARAKGFSWTTKDPRKVRNFRDAAGLPSGGASGSTNTSDFLIKGKANTSDIIKSRSALPLDGNMGGLPELIIDPKNVNITDFSVLKP